MWISKQHRPQIRSIVIKLGLLWWSICYLNNRNYEYRFAVMVKLKTVKSWIVARSNFKIREHFNFNDEIKFELMKTVLSPSMLWRILNKNLITLAIIKLGRRSGGVSNELRVKVRPNTRSGNVIAEKYPQGVRSWSNWNVLLSGN